MLLSPDPLRLFRHINPIHIQMTSTVFGIRASESSLLDTSCDTSLPAVSLPAQQRFQPAGLWGSEFNPMG